MNVGVLNFTDKQTKRMYSEYNLEEIVDLLNEQHEEIQQSKVLIKKYHNENTDLIKENEQLKKDATTLIYANQNYRKENEQLKKENRELEKFRYSVFKNSHTITEKDEHIAWKRGCE